VNWTIVRASAREVYEAYWEALERREPVAILFWREVLLERLGALNGAADDSERAPGAHRDGP
jgi:hypothetical protein